MNIILFTGNYCAVFGINGTAVRMDIDLVRLVTFTEYHTIFIVSG
jgi:hypothetical protein